MKSVEPSKQYLSDWLSIVIVIAITALRGHAVMASSSDIRKLFKAFSDNPSLHAEVRAAQTTAEKHEIIRKAGLTPVTDDDVHAELAKSLQSGVPTTPEDKEFVGSVLHLASAMSTDSGSA